MNTSIVRFIYRIEDGSYMIEYSKGNLLKDTYLSISDGISNIESFLPKVENEDMNYDLNRQLHCYRRMASLCKEELRKEGEALELIPLNQLDGAQQSDISFEYKAHVGYGKETNTDQLIAQEVVSEIQQRVDWVRKFADNSSSEAVSSIAMEIIEEEENHMDWMKSYVD